MNDAPTKLLADRIEAIVERVRVLAAERDEMRREIDALRTKLDRHELDNAKLRTALEDAIRELRQE